MRCAAHEHNELERRRSKLVVLGQCDGSAAAAGEREQAQLEQRGLLRQCTAAAAASAGCGCAEVELEVTTCSELLTDGVPVRIASRSRTRGSIEWNTTSSVLPRTEVLLLLSGCPTAGVRGSSLATTRRVFDPAIVCMVGVLVDGMPAHSVERFLLAGAAPIEFRDFFCHANG